MAETIRFADLGPHVAALIATAPPGPIAVVNDRGLVDPTMLHEAAAMMEAAGFTTTAVAEVLYGVRS